MNQKISIIVAAYNVEDYLETAIESILAQTYRNLEVILVDDGSDDRTPFICDHYAQIDSRIVVIHKENGGLSDARNAALEIATGDYIGFVDGDDWIEQDMYYAMLQACEKNKAQIAVCRYQVFDHNNRKNDCTQGVPSNQQVALNQSEILQIYLAGHEQYIIYNSVWSKLFKAEIAKKFRFQKGRKSEDIMYTTWTFCEAERFIYLDTPYYNYRADRTGSIMNSGLFERRMEHELPNWVEQIQYLKALGMEDTAKLAAYYFVRRLLFYYMEFYQVDVSQKALRKQGREYGKILVKRLQAHKTEIYQLLKLPYAKTGDRLRIKLLLENQTAYRLLHVIYERLIVTWKNK